MNQITTEIAAIIREMERNGVRLSSWQSEILQRDHGIKILPHFIAEHKYYVKRQRALK